MSEDQFVEMVETALSKHVSIDDAICDEDRKWEARNVARRLSALLRQNGFRIPEVLDHG